MEKARGRRLSFGLVLALCLQAASMKGGLGSWTPAGPPGVNVSAILVDPKTTTVYLGTNVGSIFASSDHGESWKKIYTGFGNAITGLALAGQTLYAGVGIPCYSDVTRTGVVRSDDDGHTWWPAGLETQPVSSLAVDPSHPATILAVTTTGVNRSSDGGTTWQNLFHSDGSRRVLSVAVDPTNPSFLMSGTTVGGYKSEDGGATFLPVNRPVDCFDHPSTCDNALTNLPDGYVYSFLFDPSSPGTVYAQMSLGTYRSRDRGITWLAYGPPFTRLALDTRRPGSLYGITPQGLSSIAESGNWTRVGGAPPPEFGAGTPCLAVDEGNPSRLYVGTPTAPLRSDDGGNTWTSLSATLRDLPVTTFAFDPSDPLTAYASRGRQGIFKTTDGGVRWIPTGYRDSATTVETLAVDPFDPEVLLAFTSDSDDWKTGAKRVLRSTDGGTTWARGGALPDYFIRPYSEPRVLLPDPTRAGKWYLGNQDHVDVTRDGGLSWEPIVLSDSFGIAPAPYVYALAADANSPGVVWAAGWGGLYRTKDGGSSWGLFSKTLFNVSGLAVDAKNSALYAATPTGLIDPARGTLWDPKTFSSSGEPPSSVSTDPSSAAIYVTTRSTVFRSWDSGASWQFLGEGLPQSLLSGVFVHPRDGRLAVLSQSGIYVRENCEDARTICLEGRFLVRARWATADGRSGDGMAVPLTSDTGYFWFFSPNNVETIVKLVAGCSVNSRIWTFAAGLTDVRVVLTVTDSVTGAVKTYVNPQGTPFQPIQDTDAFAACPIAAGSALPPSVASASLAATAAAATACTADATTLCVGNGRFRIQAKWTTRDGAGGAGYAVGLTGDTGYFWFFSPNSVELVAKVVSGCSVNSRYWMFAGGLTDVNVVLTVTDTQSGQARTYNNPQGTPFAPVLDAAAFATCL